MTTTNEAAEDRAAFRFEIAIIILLGLAALGTAWATFQAALYDGKQAESYAMAQDFSTEAESLYLEGDQQYTRDSETFTRLAELQVEIAAGAPLAQEKFDLLTFMSVSEELSAAMERANAANEANPAHYTSPLDDETYQASLFGGYTDKNTASEEAMARGQEYNSLSDRLTLATTVMAISLFLLGIAAVVRRRVIKLALTIGGGVVLLLGAVWTLAVPIIWL